MTREEYLKNPNKCLYCGKEILPKETDKDISKVKVKKFCNSSCAASYNNKKYPKRGPVSTKKCINCGKEIKKGQFCSRHCIWDYKHKNFIQDWKDGKENGTTGKCGKNCISDHIRKYLFEKYNSKCCKCGWGEINPTNGNIPLHIHHIDGNSKNNKEDNLELLCPNCHSLTPNYGMLNKGKSTRKYK